MLMKDESKKLLAEALGTFALVLLGAGAVIVESHTGMFHASLRLNTLFSFCLSTLNAMLVAGTGGMAIWLWVHGKVEVGTVAMALPLSWQITRQVPPKHAVSALGAAHCTPHTPQFNESSTRTASQSLAALRSQSAVPGEQFCSRPAFSGSAGSGSAGSFVALSAEIVTGTRAAQLPNPNEKQTARASAPSTTPFSFIPPLTRKH